MNLRLAAFCLVGACLAPLAAQAQVGTTHTHSTPSVIRPVGYGLWEDYDGGCGCGHKHRHGHGLGKCCGPIGCPYGVGASCGCGGCNDGCNYRIACGIPFGLNRLTRSLDCLFPCRPKLLGCGSGWGGCSPCYDPSCGGGCPKPRFGKRFGFFGGCAKCDASTNCNLDCSCGTPAATFGPAGDISTPVPVPPGEGSVNPFQDDLPEPMPTDARRNPRSRSHFSNSPTPARRPTDHQASAQPKPTTALKPVARVQRAAHTTPIEGGVVHASVKSDDVVRDYSQARSEVIRKASSYSSETEELPHNPLR